MTYCETCQQNVSVLCNLLLYTVVPFLKLKSMNNNKTGTSFT